MRVKGKSTNDRGGMLTPNDAISAGLCECPPKPTLCPYCGKALERLGVAYGRRVYWVSHVRCGCPGELEAREAKRQKELMRSKARRRDKLTDAGIGVRYMDAVPADPRCDAFAKFFSPHDGNGLYIHGPVGVGKTYNACGGAKLICERQRSVVFTTAIGMFSRIQDTYDGRGFTFLGQRGAIAAATSSCLMT
jgi:DNA replication protein DnaC